MNWLGFLIAAALFMLVVVVALGVLTLFNLQPGPLLFSKNPEFVWGLIASLYIGNVMLLVLNIAFVPAFVAMLRIPYAVLWPLLSRFFSALQSPARP
jgi:putative tricarboxylic transport membrane protein